MQFLIFLETFISSKWQLREVFFDAKTFYFGSKINSRYCPFKKRICTVLARMLYHVSSLIFKKKLANISPAERFYYNGQRMHPGLWRNVRRKGWEKRGMTPDWVESSSRSHSNVHLFAAVSAALTEIPGHLKSRFYALSVSKIGAIYASKFVCHPSLGYEHLLSSFQM